VPPAASPRRTSFASEIAWPLPKAPSRRRLDPVTTALGAAALTTTATVIGGQFLRLARRRAAAVADENVGVLETAEHALGAATLATQDTVTVAREGYAAATRGETVLFNIFTGFSGGFLFIRLSTLGIRDGWWPAGNVRFRGRHIHHFVPGIVLAFLSGGAGLVTSNERLEEALAIPFGAGIGLTLDEAALLLQLEDVYWTREGLLSLQVSFGGAALLGAAIIALRMLRSGERQSERAGLIPGETGEYAAPPPP
jgi:hypothetical protein